MHEQPFTFNRLYRDVAPLQAKCVIGWKHGCPSRGRPAKVRNESWRSSSPPDLKRTAYTNKGRTMTWWCCLGNYDPEFLGIHEQEAKLLGQKDEDFLRTVHIVPIRPSLLTMPSKYICNWLFCMWFEFLQNSSQVTWEKCSNHIVLIFQICGNLSSPLTWFTAVTVTRDTSSSQRLPSLWLWWRFLGCRPPSRNVTGSRGADG